MSAQAAEDGATAVSTHTGRRERGRGGRHEVWEAGGGAGVDVTDMRMRRLQVGLEGDTRS